MDKLKHLITNDPQRVPFNGYALFWLNSDGGGGQQHSSAQAAVDFVTKHYPNEPVEMDIIHPRLT